MPGSSSLGYVSGPAPTDAMKHQRGVTLTESGLPVRIPVTHESLSSKAENCSEPVSVPRRTLTAWNVAMALFHAGLVAITLTFGNLDLTVDVYKTNITYIEPEDGPPQLVPAYKKAGVIYFTWATAGFFALSSLFHLLNATFLRRYYLTNLASCLSPTRYLEYTFSAALMQLLISYSLGVRERMLLIASAVLVGITMPFGYWTEQVARPKNACEWEKPLRARLFPWVIGHIPQITAWAIIIVNFYDEDDGTAPDFVHAILWAELVLFFSFGFVALFQQLNQPRFFYRGELAFQVLSLAAKGLLGGILLTQVLMLSSFEEVY